LTPPRRPARRAGDSIPSAQKPAIDPAFAARFPAISSALNTSTIGIVICDGAMRCVLANHVFASMIGAPAEKPVGKTFGRFFGPGAPTIETAFQRVWDTGRPVSNVEFHESSPANPGGLTFGVYLRPIKDASGAMRFIAAIFSDATAKGKLHRRLNELAGLPQSAPPEPQTASEEFAEVPVESARVLRRGIDILTCSAVVRCHLSEMRITNAFLPSGLFVVLEADTDKTYREALQRMVSINAAPAEANASRESNPAAKTPSPRERQIVRLLAEGKANKEIAAILALSTRTVEIYRARLMEKLDLHSVGELVRYAFRNHIVEV
jgi:DNA-binding CsgD family transcriptional regulator